MADPIAVACTNCMAKAGEPCTQPTATGRRAVAWLHFARRDAALALESPE